MHECVVDQAGAEILRYQYDRAGQLTNRWSAAKGNTGYAFDGVGNLTNINYPASPDINVQYDAANPVAFGYDLNGNLRTNGTRVAKATAGQAGFAAAG